MVMAIYILTLAAQLVLRLQIVFAIRACSLISTRRALARHNTADRARWPRGSPETIKSASMNGPARAGAGSRAPATRRVNDAHTGGRKPCYRP